MTPRRLAISVFALSALAACHPSHPSRACLAERGCPPPREPVACPADTVHTLDELATAGRDWLGQTLTLRGPYRPGIGWSTLVECGPGICCNGSGAPGELRERVEATRDGDHARDVELDGLECRGDDSLVCCPVREGSVVEVRGRLEWVESSGNRAHWLLREAVLCRPAPATPAPSGR